MEKENQGRKETILLLRVRIIYTQSEYIIIIYGVRVFNSIPFIQNWILRRLKECRERKEKPELVNRLNLLINFHYKIFLCKINILYNIWLILKDNNRMKY